MSTARDFPPREALRALIAGYVGLFLAVISVATFLRAQFVGYGMVWVSVAGAWGVVIARHCLAPRPAVPVLTLLVGMALMAWFAAACFSLLALMHMH